MGLNSAGLSASGGGSGGGGGGIDQITSTGGTATITDPTGPVTNIEVTSSYGDWIYGSGADGAFTVKAARTVTDGVLGSNGTFLTFSSATANFVSGDVGQPIACLTSGSWPAPPIPHFVITSIVSGTEVVLNAYKPAWLGYVFPTPVSGLTVRIGGMILQGQYTDLTIPLGVTARLSPYTYDVAVTGTVFLSTNIVGEVLSIASLFQCTGTFTIDGTLDLSGANGSGTTAGISADQCGGGFGSPGTTSTGANANLDATGNQTNGPTGAPGGSGTSGLGGAGSAPFYAFLWLNPAFLVPSLTFIITGTFSILSGIGDLNGGGGGSGSGDGVTNSGGASGEGGVGAVIVARHVVHGGANNYNLQGGNGANGEAAGCGGGGGGGMGWWVTISDDLTGTANITGTGGTGGTAGGAGGTAGGNGDTSPGHVRFLNKAS